MEGSLPLLRQVYRFLYRSGLPLDKALQTLRSSLCVVCNSGAEGERHVLSLQGKEWVDETGSLQHLLQFLEDSLSQPQRRGPLPALRGRGEDPPVQSTSELDD